MGGADEDAGAGARLLVVRLPLARPDPRRRLRPGGGQPGRCSRVRRQRGLRRLGAVRTRYSLLATRYSLLTTAFSFFLLAHSLTHSLTHSSTCCHAAPHTRYVFTSVMERYNRAHRPGVRTMMLGCSSSSHLASHRTPVWWTGDNQYDALALAVAQMVDGGVQVGLTTSSAFSYFFLLATNPLYSFSSHLLFLSPCSSSRTCTRTAAATTAPESAAAARRTAQRRPTLARCTWRRLLARHGWCFLVFFYSLTHSLLLSSFSTPLLLYLFLLHHPIPHQNQNHRYARWVQFCATGTVFRLHSDPAQGRQPWRYGAAALNVSRAFLRMRRQLLPMLVSAGARAHTEGVPLVRRCDLSFPGAAQSMLLNSSGGMGSMGGSTLLHGQYLLGDDLLVAPVDPFRGKVRSYLTATH